MMRRSRLSIKPNFKPGSRTGTEGEQASQTATIADNTLKAEQSHQQSATLKEPSEDVDLKGTPEMPTKINQNDGASSSGAVISSTAPHRRMRISAAPKLVRPKLSSTPRTQTSASMPSSAPSPLPNEKQGTETSVSVTSVSVISNSLSKSGTPRKSTSTTETSNTLSQSTSLCVPSTSGLRKSLASGKNAMEDSPPSPQPGQVPQQPPPQEPELSECLSVSDRSLACIKLSQSKTGSSEMSEKSSDKDRILRALKLKELMKIERRKDIRKEKRRVGHKDYTAVDRSQMTMRDLIYYLPNTSPMRSSVEGGEDPEEIVIPPSPKEQIKIAEKDDEDEEEEESENEEMLMPRVRVAEDGSIMLDEDSLTVRVQRSSDTKLVENSATLFERGSTTTYSSFKTLSYVKSWSVRETDLFFLAISMVGTDFSLIGQLLTHRSRAAIKSKFKKEEKVNPWRVDKALRNNRPFDKEFFSYLLEKVLAKDKDKRKSIKLMLPKTRKPRRSKGKKSNKKVASDDEEENVDDNVFHVADEDVEDDGPVSLEKESDALSNVKEANPPAKKRRKRTIDISESKDKASCSGEQVKSTRQRKCSKTSREVHSKEDSEGERNLNDESDSLNVNKENELKRSTSAPKRGRRHSKDDEEQQNEKPVKRRKGKKSLKVVCDQEESVSKHEESSIVDDEGSATTKKRKRAKNIDLDGEVPVTGKKNPKRKRALKKEGTAEEESSADLQDAEQLNTPVTAEVGNNVSPKATKRSKKPLPKLARTRSKKRKVPETSAESEKESQDEENHESILTAADSPLEDERLQMQAVVVLEETPPRQQYLLSPSKIKFKNNELEPSRSSPTSGEGSSSQQSRMRRAGRVKRDLSSSQKAEKRKGLMDQDEPVSVSPMVLLESITREDEDEDNSLNENLIDLSCLRDVDSHVFQRRPMVVLSREEVDMILNASEQSAEEDPSVSPLDLSLNTELSFPFQCSKLLEDNDDADVVDYMEENEKSTNVEASCEANNFEELELTESALAQPDMSSLRNNSTPLNLEVCSQPEAGLSKVTTSCSTGEVEPQVHPMAHEDVTVVAAVLDVPPSLVFLENVDPICMKREAPVTQEKITSEAATLGTPSVVSDLMKESEKAILPSLPKEGSELDSSEITAQSKLTSVGSGLGSRRPLQADEEVKAELQKSLEVPSQTLAMLQDVSEGKEDAQEIALGSPEIKARTQNCAVGLEVTEDSQEEASVQSSSASVSTEHGIRPTRRSRFLKPKPNLSQKTRVLQNQRQNLQTPSALKLKSRESTGPTEKSLYSPANDQDGSFEHFSKQNLNKEKETSPSNAMDRTEFESTKDVSDASTAVTDQENITTASLHPTSVAEPQEASECCSSRCDVDITPPCTSPQSSQKVEDMGSGQMIVPSEDVCAPAEIVHITDDGHNDEEPTFILTLYEIPVTEADLPSSRNDPVVISDLPKDETQPSLGFSDPAHSLPSKSVPSSIDPLQPQTNLGIVTKDLSENSERENSANTSLDITSPHTKDKDGDPSARLEMGISTFDPQPECKNSSEIAPFDSAPSSHGTPSGFSISKCITTISQDLEDTEQCERVSHMLLDDVFVPVSEEMGDNSFNGKAMNVECKLESFEDTTVRVTKDSTKNAKEQICNYLRSHESILLEKKDELGDACENLVTGVLIKNPDSDCKMRSEFAPLGDLSSSMNQSSSSGSNVSKCITLHQDSGDKDTEQCERVSLALLSDLIVPVLEEMQDNSSKNWAIAVECKLKSNEASTVGVTEDLAENVKQKISEGLTSRQPVILETKDEESDACVNLNSSIHLHLDPESECKNDSEIVPSKNLACGDQSTPSEFNLSKCITLHQDSNDDVEQCVRVSHMMLGDIFVPVSEDLEDDLSKERKMAVDCNLESNEASTVSVTEYLEENVKEQISKELTSQETIVLDLKDESNASVNVTHLDPHSECKNSSEIAPHENFSSRTQSTPSRLNTSRCFTLHQDLEDTQQCERVSHVLLGDVFVPVLEELDNDLNRTKVVECKEISIVSLPERQDTETENVSYSEVENLPSVSNPLLRFNSTKESKCTTALSEKTKASPRRRDRQKVKPQPKLVKRACAKVDSSKTEVVKGPNQPTSSHVILPASCEENMPRISNTTTETSGKRTPSMRGNKTSASKGQGAKFNFTAEESPEITRGHLEVMETKPITTAVHLSKEPKLDQEKSKNVMGDTIDKDDMEPPAEDKQLSISTASESANVQTCCEAMHFNVLKSSGSGPSTVDSVKTRIKAQGVSHLVLPDVFVLVSDVKKDILSNDWTVSIKSSPQRVSLSEKAVTHFQKELITEDVAQQYVEDSTQSQLPLEETKTPVRKRAKTKPDLQSPQDASSAQLPTLPQSDNMLLLEEKLQKKHYIVPCSVKLSSLDIVDQSLCASQLGDRRSNEKTTVMSSPTCHVNVMTVSGESSRSSLLGKVALEGPEVEKKSPTRRKDKKTESSPDEKHGHLKPVQTGSQTRQLTIADWVKKRSRQTETNQQEKQPAKSPQKVSRLKAKDVRQLVVEKTCSKSQHADSDEPGGSRLVPSLEETKEVNSASTEGKRSSEMVKQLTKDTSVAQVKKSPPKRRAKLQVKPTLAKRVRTESNTSTSDQQQPARFIAPTRQRAQAAKEKEKSENKNEQPVKNVTNTSRVEARLKCKGSPPIASGPISPKSQDVWPKVVLPRAKLSTLTSSPARVSQSTSPPVTPPQMKKSPTQSSSPAANEHLDDDPARVSQFFLSDIFTEVEEAE